MNNLPTYHVLPRNNGFTEKDVSGLESALTLAIADQQRVMIDVSGQDYVDEDFIGHLLCIINPLKKMYGGDQEGQVQQQPYTKVFFNFFCRDSAAYRSFQDSGFDRLFPVQFETDDMRVGYAEHTYLK